MSVEILEAGSKTKEHRSDIESQVREFWDVREKLRHPSPKGVGASETLELGKDYPHIIEFYDNTAETMDNNPEKLKKLNFLWQKYILGKEMTEAEKGELEAMYREHLEKKHEG